MPFQLAPTAAMPGSMKGPTELQTKLGTTEESLPKVLRKQEWSHSK